jgi:hypothetical protein
MRGRAGFSEIDDSADGRSGFGAGIYQPEGGRPAR